MPEGTGGRLGPLCFPLESQLGLIQLVPVSTQSRMHRRQVRVSRLHP